jgi:hypothetical protein
MKTKLSLSLVFLTFLPALAFAELSECNGIWTNDPCDNPTSTMTESNNPVVPKPIEPEVVENNNPAPRERAINNNQGTNNPPQNSNEDEDDGDGTDVQVNYGGGEYTNRRLPENGRNVDYNPAERRTGVTTRPATRPARKSGGRGGRR